MQTRILAQHVDQRALHLLHCLCDRTMPEVVEAWVSELCQRFGHGPIAEAVEQVKGALVYMLRKYACLHLYPVLSTMTAKMREALCPSGAKDDPRDADLLLDLLLQHRDKLRRLTPDSEATRRSALSTK